MIDFPQMVSVSHRNAEMYFDRDLECIFKFFGKRFNYSPTGVSKVITPLETVDGAEEEGDGRPEFEAVAGGEGTLDKELEASGFTRKNQEVLEQNEAEEERKEDAAESSGEDTQLQRQLEKTRHRAATAVRAKWTSFLDSSQSH